MGPDRGLIGDTETFREGESIGVLKTESDEPGDQIGRGLRGVLSDAEIKRLIEPSVHVREVYPETTNGRRQRHAVSILWEGQDEVKRH
jgi:hypothetical protein